MSLQASTEEHLEHRTPSPKPGDDVYENENFSLAQIVEGLKSQDLATKTAAARAGRRMLSKELSPPITPMVQAGIIAPLVEALDRDDCSDLQLEAAWSLAEIAAGTQGQTKAVVDAGAIPKLTALLGKRPAVAEQAAWALGNIAGDGPETRDSVLAHGALPAILPYMRPDTPLVHLRTVVWFYTNLCRAEMVNLELVSPALPYISELLEIKDLKVLADACWALAHLTKGSIDRRDAVQATPRLVDRLISLLGHEALDVKTPALKAVGHMLNGSDIQIDRCLEANCLDHLILLLQSHHSSIVKEAVRISRILLDGTHSQIQRALDNGILAPLFSILTDGDDKCKKEAAWAITNLCVRGTPEQLGVLIKSPGFLEPYCALLPGPDHWTTLNILRGLFHLLKASVQYLQAGTLCSKLREMGVLDQLEEFKNIKDDQVSMMSHRLLHHYFYYYL